MPPTTVLPFVSRYALEVTVPGTVSDALSIRTLAGAILIPARATASGVSVISTSSSGVADRGAAAVGGDAAGGDGAVVARRLAPAVTQYAPPSAPPPISATATTPTATQRTPRARS